MSQPARIGIVGNGWRAEAYFRVARARPDLFAIESALVRSESNAERLRNQWGVTAYTSEQAFIATAPDYVIVCVARAAAPRFTIALAAAGLAVLCETPLSPDLRSTLELVHRLGDDPRVQVAEQYRFQPHHAARLRVAGSGLLGRIGSVRASVAHDYHAVSLMRHALGVGFQNARIDARTTVDRSISPLSSAGWTWPAPIAEPGRTTARLCFDDGSEAEYDFSDEQYFSPIRSRHLLIRGENGEISDDDVRYLTAEGDPVRLALTRDETGLDGDLEGRFLRRIRLGADEVYANPLAPARLSDDEIAIATVLLRMNDFASGGGAFYDISEAAQDHYLALSIAESARTGRTVQTVDQPWATETRAFGQATRATPG